MLHIFCWFSRFSGPLLNNRTRIWTFEFCFSILNLCSKWAIYINSIGFNLIQWKKKHTGKWMNHSKITIFSSLFLNAFEKCQHKKENGQNYEFALFRFQFALYFLVLFFVSECSHQIEFSVLLFLLLLFWIFWKKIYRSTQNKEESSSFALINRNFR